MDLKFEISNTKLISNSKYNAQSKCVQKIGGDDPHAQRVRGGACDCRNKRSERGGAVRGFG